MTLQVKDIAYVRSGDKGDVCSVGLVARGPQEYAQLLASVTPADVKGLYGDWVQGEVECHPMDNIGAMMVIMRHALGAGRRAPCAWTRPESRWGMRCCACRCVIRAEPSQSNLLTAFH